MAEPLLDRLAVPVVLAPLAGGPSTPELAAAVAGAGGLGFLAAGYLTAAELGERLGSLRALASGPVGVNLFVAGDRPADPAALQPWLDELRQWARRTGAALGEPRYSDDDWEAKLELLIRRPVDVVSFTFGCPEPSVSQALHAVGTEVWVTVTAPAEAVEAQAAGADVLVVQGAEAGGHRASFVDRPNLPLYGLLPLLALVRQSSTLPLVASGGIGSGALLAAALCAGARAAQIGTAFLLCPEAGTSEPQRAALQRPGETGLTRAFTGRLARGIRNRFMEEHGPGAPIAYPEIHYVTAPMRRRARQEGEAELINLWAGEAYQLATARPAAEIVAQLVGDARAALGATRLPPAAPGM